jgi:transposase-like protein
MQNRFTTVIAFRRRSVISCAVRWYFRFQLSLRDIEELLFERGVIVSYEASDAGAASSVRTPHTVRKRRGAGPAPRGNLRKYL